MAFDPNRDIVEDLLNDILRGVEVPDFNPLAEIERAVEVNLDDDEDFDEAEDEYDENEYGGERRRKRRRKARYHNRYDWTPLQRRRVAGDSPPGKAAFTTRLLDDAEGATAKQLERFRTHFRAPPEVVSQLVEEMKRGGFEDKSDRRGKRGVAGHRLDLYVACCLRILATGNSLEQEELWSGISAQSLHAFLDKFIEFYGETVFERHVYMPDRETLAKYERIEDLCGFPGAFGNVDGTNLLCCKYPFGRQFAAMSGYKMKNQTSVNVVVIVSPTAEVLHVSQMYPGATNDSRIARQDEVIRGLCSNPVFKDFAYHVFTRAGEKVEKTGAYLKADGGFGYDRRLVSTFRIVIDESDNEGFFNNVHESRRSMVECFFGRWKQRFKIVKNGFYQQSERKIHLLIRTTIALMNILTRYDRIHEIGERDDDFCLIRCEVRDAGVDALFPKFLRRGQIREPREVVDGALTRFDDLEARAIDREEHLDARNDNEDTEDVRKENFREHRNVLVENLEERARTNTLFWPKKYDEVFVKEDDEESDDDWWSDDESDDDENIEI
jgi:hypothetical protein